MRINLNGETSLVNTWDGPNQEWLDHIQAEFCRSYDLNPENSQVISYLWIPDAAKDMAGWLQSQGYRVSYYQLDYRPRPDDSRTICFGLDFDDHCPRFIELRLKHGV